MDSSNIALVLSSLGLGGLIGVFAKSFLDRKAQVFERQFDYKEKRYKSLLVFMWVKANGEDVARLGKFYGRPDVTSKEELNNELDIEINHALLFASDEVLGMLEIFRDAPNMDSWRKTAKSMRKDLYG